MTKQDRAAYMREYMRQYRAIRIPLREDDSTDEQIARWLDQKPNKSRYIKGLILQDMERAAKVSGRFDPKK